MNRRLSSPIHLLILLGFGPFPVQSYVTQPSHYPKGHGSAFPTEASKSSVTKQPVKYYFGLGKNPPIANNSRNGHNTLSTNDKQYGNTEEDTFEAARYWNDHQAVRSIPSPLSSDAVTPESVSMQRRSSAESKPRIQYNRRSEDVLFIYEQNSLEAHRITPQQNTPTMVADTQGAQLDMNTPWVEMLLHSEKSKAMAKQAAR